MRWFVGIAFVLVPEVTTAEAETAAETTVAPAADAVAAPAIVDRSWSLLPLVGLEYDLELGLGGNLGLLVGRRDNARGGYTCRGVEGSLEIYDGVQAFTVGYTNKAVSKFGLFSHSIRLGALRSEAGELFDEDSDSRNYATLVGDLQALLPLIRVRVITNGQMDRTLVTGGLLFKF